ncbi:Sugar/inositol transporter [Fusarium oxysporum f. sp. vasinfectum]|nr:Sugar/inositol transporter [Fusarium oxysporum f. sp. vasinfectum]KAK2933988.1 Sugar/inositol transporter [Fusarium oxysporum f. sp. vasinfectum]
METIKETQGELLSDPTPQDGRTPEAKTRSKTAVLQNPLANMTHDELVTDAENFAQDKGLDSYRPWFSKGALIAKVINTPKGYEAIEELTEEDKELLRNEDEHRWKSQPKMLYFLCALCAGCAIVQGMDQTVINGAQHFYFEEYKIKDRALQGLTNGAPYASAALIGCWLNAPLNRYFGRRGTIAFSCLLAFVTGIWQAAANSWTCLLIARFTLGLAVGAKSSTTPVYAAECAPKAIRGALTMMWQMWAAFGIMLGFASSLAFQNIKWPNQYAPWRWMIGSTALPPLIVGLLIFLLPESPRCCWDFYLAWKFLEAEQNSKEGRKTLKELFTVRRNWRAAQSSWFCMLMQQFCGVNVIAYYSTKIFTDAGYTRSQALLASFGGGTINWVFALPAIWTIDTFGRRNLLAEAFPLHIRALGMASATSITWSFNFLLSLTWPMMEKSFKPSGAFYWYATWNVVGSVFTYFLLPETKALSLEELDIVFSVRNRDHVRYYSKRMGWYAKRLMGRSPDPMPPLYELENSTVGSMSGEAVKQTNSSSV